MVISQHPNFNNLTFKPYICIMFKHCVLYLPVLFFTVVCMAFSVKTPQPDVNASINKVLADYLEVKNALFAGNGDAASNKAKQLFASIGNVSVKGMSPAQQQVWNNYTNKLQFDSRHISETNAIAHQREHFASLSKNMYIVVKAFKANTAVIYQQYCPMKKAYWLSESAEIKNPYYGADMADCGKITETLKPANK